MIQSLPWSSAMVDMPSLYSPLSPLGDPILDSPLCGELIGDMEVLEDISQSLSDDTFNSLQVLDYQSNNSAADSSTGLGRAYGHTILTNRAP